MGKILFIDVDGTLMNYSNELPDSAVEGIRQVRAQGHKVFICTGRSRAEVPEWLWAIGLDGMIGGNGSYIEHQGQVVMHKTLSLEQCTRVVDWLHQRQLEFYIESNSGLFASKNFREASQPVLLEYEKRKGRDTSKQKEHVIHGMIFGSPDLYRDDVNKISFILGSYQDHLDSKEAFPDLVANTWGGAGGDALFGDLGVKDIDKAVAIDILLKHLGADVKDTYAFGDARIDIPMFEHCAMGIAVGSGTDEAKAAADYVTDTVDNDGLYKAFVYLGLIENALKDS